MYKRKPPIVHVHSTIPLSCGRWWVGNNGVLGYQNKNIPPWSYPDAVGAGAAAATSAAASAVCIYYVIIGGRKMPPHLKEDSPKSIRDFAIHVDPGKSF